jgi:hypothetical protein
MRMLAGSAISVHLPLCLLVPLCLLIAVCAGCGVVYDSPSVVKPRPGHPVEVVLGYALHGRPAAIAVSRQRVVAVWPSGAGERIAVWRFSSDTGLCGRPRVGDFIERGSPTISLTCSLITRTHRPPGVQVATVRGSAPKSAAVSIATSDVFAAVEDRRSTAVMRFDSRLRLRNRWGFGGAERPWLFQLGGSQALVVTVRVNSMATVAKLFRLQDGQWKQSSSFPLGPRGVLAAAGAPSGGAMAVQDPSGLLDVIRFNGRSQVIERRLLGIVPRSAAIAINRGQLAVAYSGINRGVEVFGVRTWSGGVQKTLESPNNLRAVPVGVSTNSRGLFVVISAPGAGPTSFARRAAAELAIASTAVYTDGQWRRTDARVGIHPISARTEANNEIAFIGEAPPLRSGPSRVGYQLASMTH